jgi:hypothetical protein
MNYFYLFLGAGSFIVLLIIIYDIQNRKKVNEILRANKNVPPLFMLRSADLKIAAIRTALNIPDYGDVETEQAKENLIKQLDKLVAGYKNREMPLTAYYAKLGSLLISVNKFRASVSGAQVQVHA